MSVLDAKRYVGKLALEGSLQPCTAEDAEFLDDCIQVLTGCRFGEPYPCDHEDCK